MRVLLAYDGSAGADQALALSGGIAWPPETAIHVVNVLEPVALAVIGPFDRGAGYSPELDAAISGYAEERLTHALDQLRAGGHRADGRVLRGRAGSAILDAANEIGADVIIVGSRGHGAISSLLLGSVSGEVVDHASCPVLVARGATLRRAVIATDGSPAAAAAESLLAGWPVFASVPIEVVSVVDVDLPWLSGIAPTAYAQVLETHAEELRVQRHNHERLATDAAERLRAAGRDARPWLREGDPATEIVAVAGEQGADLIVLGSRGRTGLTRLLLGSVARNVVSGSEVSVLIVHERPGPDA